MDERIEILSISHSQSGKLTVEVLVKNMSGSERVEFSLLPKHSKALELSTGKISRELLCDIEYYSEVARAYNSAYSSFTYSPSSLRALKQKLYQKGFPRDVCNEAIELVESDGYVREGEIATRRAQIFVEKMWGRGRIIAKLREEGFVSSAIEEADAYISNVDFEENCSIVIKKKYGAIPEDIHEREKMYAYLSRQGYLTADIHKAVRLLVSEKQA